MRSSKFKARKTAVVSTMPRDTAVVEAVKIADLAVDLWKIHARSKIDNASERVIAACERAEDRLGRLGFNVESLEGKLFDTNMRAKVVDHQPSDGPLVVGECLSPAVYFNQCLVREAEIVTTGGSDTHGQDS